MIKGIIFDLDGTLLNTIDDIADSVNAVLKKHGLPTHTVEEYKTFVGSGAKVLITSALGEMRTTKNCTKKFLTNISNITASTERTRPHLMRA